MEEASSEQPEAAKAPSTTVPAVAEGKPAPAEESACAATDGETHDKATPPYGEGKVTADGFSEPRDEPLKAMSVLKRGASGEADCEPEAKRLKNGQSRDDPQAHNDEATKELDASVKASVEKKSTSAEPTLKSTELESGKSKEPPVCEKSDYSGDSSQSQKEEPKGDSAKMSEGNSKVEQGHTEKSKAEEGTKPKGGDMMPPPLPSGEKSNAGSTATASQGILSAACLRCRHRKEKCDGEKPQCSRCVKSGANCLYVVKQKPGRRSGSTNSVARGSEASGSKQKKDEVGSGAADSLADELLKRPSSRFLTPYLYKQVALHRCMEAFEKNIRIFYPECQFRPYAAVQMWDICRKCSAKQFRQGSVIPKGSDILFMIFEHLVVFAAGCESIRDGELGLKFLERAVQLRDFIHEQKLDYAEVEPLVLERHLMALVILSDTLLVYSDESEVMKTVEQGQPVVKALDSSLSDGLKATWRLVSGCARKEWAPALDAAHRDLGSAISARNDCVMVLHHCLLLVSKEFENDIWNILSYVNNSTPMSNESLMKARDLLKYCEDLLQRLEFCHERNSSTPNAFNSARIVMYCCRALLYDRQGASDEAQISAWVACSLLSKITGHWFGRTGWMLSMAFPFCIQVLAKTTEEKFVNALTLYSHLGTDVASKMMPSIYEFYHALSGSALNGNASTGEPMNSYSADPFQMALQQQQQHQIAMLQQQAMQSMPVFVMPQNAGMRQMQMMSNPNHVLGAADMPKLPAVPGSMSALGMPNQSGTDDGGAKIGMMGGAVGRVGMSTDPASLQQFGSGMAMPGAVSGTIVPQIGGQQVGAPPGGPSSAGMPQQ